ncbi:MAG: site-2 protease family protein [Thermoanaerobaculia bacterium]
MTATDAAERLRCECGTELSASLLACPSCRRLVHRRRLEELAVQAERAEEGGDLPAALVAWREALELLPAESSQARRIADRVTAARARAPAASLDAAARDDASGRRGSWLAKRLAPLGVVGVLLWKFKFVLVAILGKAKLALLGLTKLGTLTSMLASFGLYWAIWGWPLAAGLIVSIYLHEMGHVARLAQLGMKVDAPMFVPGLGAYVRLRQRPLDAVEDARIGLAGPIWGLGAALASVAVWWATGSGLALAIAHLGAWINLFNLLPLGPLDGGRAFRALSGGGRWLATAALAAAWVVSREGLLLLLIVVAIWRALRPDSATTDRRALAEYVGLVAALTAILLLPAALPATP